MAHRSVLFRLLLVSSLICLRLGHSLGGALAGLLGATFGVPVVAFEAPGEKMAARRLHLPSPVRIFFLCRPRLQIYLIDSPLAAAVNPAYHSRLSHCGCDSHGSLQRRLIILRHRRIRNGKPVRVMLDNRQSHNAN